MQWACDGSLDSPQGIEVREFQRGGLPIKADSRKSLGLKSTQLSYQQQVPLAKRRCRKEAQRKRHWVGMRGAAGKQHLEHIVARTWSVEHFFSDVFSV